MSFYSHLSLHLSLPLHLDESTSHQTESTRLQFPCNDSSSHAYLTPFCLLSSPLFFSSHLLSSRACVISLYYAPLLSSPLWRIAALIQGVGKTRQVNQTTCRLDQPNPTINQPTRNAHIILGNVRDTRTGRRWSPSGGEEELPQLRPSSRSDLGDPCMVGALKSIGRD